MAGTIYYASLVTETNSFSNIPTTYESFEQGSLLRGRSVLHRHDGSLRPGFESLVKLAAEQGLVFVPGLAADAAPGAPILHRDYERLRDELLDGLRAAMPVSAVFLALHGAMLSTQCMDCEGDILQRVREIVGPATPVGAVLDPHAHLTLAMVEAADILVFMKEYPHTDGHERSEELLRVLLAMLNGSVAPTPAVFDCQWIGIFPTNTEPMRGFVDRLFERERAPGVLSISFVHGFPWGDTPHTGAKVLVYTNRSPDLAADVARRVHSDLWSLRDRLGLPLTSIDDMLHQLREPRTAPLLIADVADNPGGGAPADSTFVLRALRSAGVRNAVLGLLIDPEAVRMCHQVGVGGHVCLRVGGKVSRFSGDPVDLEAEVCGLARSAVMDVLGLAEFAMGDTAWIHADGIDVALGSIRVQTYAPSAFTHLGIDLAGKTAIAVKSSTHFAAAFNAVSRDVVHVASPGALDFDVAALPFRVFDRHFHPRDKITFEPQE